MEANVDWMDYVLTASKKVEEIDGKIRDVQHQDTSTRRQLKEFEDTGNAHISVSYNHGSGREVIGDSFSKDYQYVTSDRVRDAVIEDIKRYLHYLELQLQELKTERETIKKQLREYMKQHLDDQGEEE